MPYYKWCGVNMNAQILSGVSFARSHNELGPMLFGRDISLISGKQTNAWRYRRAYSLASIITMFRQLASLVQSGLQLPHALRTLAKRLPRSHFQEIVYAISADIDEGFSLSQSLEQYTWLFSPIMINMVRVAEQTGNIGVGLDALSNYLESVQHFRRRMTGVLLLPTLTLCFFLFIAGCLLLFVVPSFQDIFAQFGQPVSVSTRFLLTASSLLRGYHMLIIASIVIMILLVQKITKKFFSTHYGAYVLLHMPFVGLLVRDSAIMHTFHAVGLLTSSGMPLIIALRVALCLLENPKLQLNMAMVIQAVEAGYTFHDALVSHGGYFAQEDVLALVSIAEESGELSETSRTIARLYEENVNRILQKITLLVQPILVILLGALITGMILAIYVPLFTVAHHL